MTTDALLFDIQAGTAWIRLNRPQVLNAMDPATTRQLLEALDRCQDSQVRAVILTGTGKAFSAGGDMKAAQAFVEDEGKLPEYFQELTTGVHQIVTTIMMLGKPVLAAINGITAGAGLSMAAACDVRLASRSARFKQGFTSLGLVPLGGWSMTMPALIGREAAQSWVYHDRVIEAGQALSMGLVSGVVDDDQLEGGARHLALGMSAGPPLAYARTKQIMFSAQFEGLQEQMRREQALFVAQTGTSEFAEGLAAFLEKRPPNYSSV
ncbi:MAG: enoyl-CoA hydratase/isomerase family protein [Anaerolineales bacterium]